MEVEVQASVCALNDSWGDGKHLSSLLQSWDHTQFLKRATNVEMKSILAIFNEWMANHNKLADGMQLLHKIVAQCSDEVLNENISTWIERTVSVLTRNKYERSTWVTLMVLRNLIEKSTKFQNMNKVISSQVVSQVVQCLQHPQLRVQAFDCLIMCLKHYGGSCGAHKVVIERHIAEVAGNGDGTEILLAAKCVAWLPLAGGGGTQQVGHQAAWKLMQLRIIGALQKEMDVLFENVRELPMSVAIDSTQILPLVSLTETRPVARLQQLQLRISNLCCYLSNLLIEPMPLTKSILVQEIMQLICRGLAVTALSLGSNVQTVESQALRALLPTVHVSLFQLLNALISVMGKNMLLYHPIIYQLIINTLKWTKDEKSTSGIVRPYSDLRIAAYETLTLWVQEAQSLSGIQHFIDEILPHIVPDITPEKDSVSLKVTKQNGKGKKRKSKGQGVDDIYKLQSEVLVTGNSALCEAALETVTAAIQAAGCLLKPEHHKMLHQLIMPAAVDLLRGGEPHPLFERPTCRVQLLELLLALVLQPHPQVPPPTSWAITVFNAGQRSKCHEVCQLSKQALRMCERIVHPTVPSLMHNYSAVSDEAPTLFQPQQSFTNDDFCFQNIQETRADVIPTHVESVNPSNNNNIEEVMEESVQEPDVVSIESSDNSSDIEEVPVILEATKLTSLPSQVVEIVPTQNGSSERRSNEIIVDMDVEQQNTNLNGNLTPLKNVNKKPDDEDLLEMLKDFTDETC